MARMTESASPDGTQLAVREPNTTVTPAGMWCGLPMDFTEQMQFAEFVSTSDLVPKALQGKPANVFLVMQKAIALNLAWDIAMSGIHVIDAKVTPGAKLLRILLRRAGHDFEPHDITDKGVTATLTLAHRPNRPVEVTYTIAEAQTAGLTKKQVWQSYVKSMLIAAVTRRAVDWYCPEVAAGLDLSDETLAATFGDPAPIQVTSEIVRDTGAGDPKAAAQELITQAQAATTPEDVAALGKDARNRNLLDVTVSVDTGEGNETLTLKEALLALMEKAEKTAADAAK